MSSRPLETVDDSVWEDVFRDAIDAFRSSDYEDALGYINEAIRLGGERFAVYDSRAAVHEKLGNIKQALRDSKKAIELGPNMRHGYSRSARLFLRLEKYDAALEMSRLALERVKMHNVVQRAELQRLQQTILDARTVRGTLEAQQKPHVSKLPVELVSEVFTLATDMDIAFPVCASLVCVHWRSIALSIPSLWRCVALSHVRPVKKLEQWLERSKQRITGLRIRASISRLQLQDALAACGPDLCKYLKSVHCEVNLILFTSYLCTLPNVADLNVEDIRVSGVNQDPPGTLVAPLGPLVPLGRASSARSLVVEYVTVDWSIVAPRLSHLHTLTIRDSTLFPTMPLIHTLLESNPHLEQLILETGDPLDVAQVTTKTRIVLPRLSHIELLGPMHAYNLISCLSLPVIERLVISQSQSAADRVLLAIDPPSPLLSELSIHKCTFSEVHLATFLQSMSALTRLEITHSGGPMDIVVEAVSSQAHLLLQHVNFSHCPKLHGGPIVQLVRPRLVDPMGAAETTSTPLPTPIKTIQIDGCPRIDPVVPEWLRTKVEKVSCVYMSKAEFRNRRRSGLI